MNAMQKVKVAAVVSAFVFLFALGGRAIYKHYRWKRFAVVHPGRLYRSGQLAEHQLESAIDKFKLKTVVSMVEDTADRERRICQDKAVKFHLFAMPSNGQGRPEQFAVILDLISDPKNQPVLIHCRAGVARTGAAVALLRMTREGWMYDQALEELKTFERRGRCEPSLQEHIRDVHAYLESKRTSSVADRPAAPIR